MTRSPVPALAAAAAFALGWESMLWAGPFSQGPDTAPAWWYLPPAAATLAALAWTWPRRHDLHPVPVVALAVALHLGFLAVHGVSGHLHDVDIGFLYPSYGQQFLQAGTLPAVEYPPLAVVAFAAARLLGPVWLTLPLLVLPLLALAWDRAARLSPHAPWVVAAVALTPTLIAFWDVRYDALPAALAVLGLVAAHRHRWVSAGLLLGAGAAAKWFPILAVVVLAAALLRRRHLRAAARLGAGALAAVAAFTLPFLASPDALLAPYRFHAGRGINGESLPYLILRALGLVRPPEQFWMEAGVPGWAPAAALAVLAAALAAVAAAAWRAPERAIALAAVAPAVFLLGNRIFSPQFLLPVALLWAVALARRQTVTTARALTFAGGLLVAATANYAVWPTSSPGWEALQVLLFAAAGVATAAAAAGRGVASGAPDQSHTRSSLQTAARRATS